MKPQALRSKMTVKPSPKRLKRIPDTRGRVRKALNVTVTPSDIEEEVRDAPRKVYAEDRLEKVLANKASCRKELKRLNAMVVRLTASGPNEKAKKLVFDMVRV